MRYSRGERSSLLMECSQMTSKCGGQLYLDTSLTSFLDRLATIVCGMSGVVGSSVSLLTPAGDEYVKVAERGIACHAGKRFSLNEGLTGEVLAHRRPVGLVHYWEAKAGHLPVGHPARDAGVAGIPIWWRGDVIGVNVVFASTPRRLFTREIDQLEVLAQLAVPGIILAAGRDLGFRYHCARPPEHTVQGGGTHGPADGRRARGWGGDFTADECQDTLLTSQFTALYAELDEHVATHLRPQRTQAPTGADQRGPAERILDSSTRLEAFCDENLLRPATRSECLPAYSSFGMLRPAAGSPFTSREQEVANLLTEGLSDRAIARKLLISSKTVEKHVGAVLRKTNAESRTAAVVRALELGWVQASWPPRST